ncbi:hypothetical protein XENTR_v10004883 [Xenopus tropicalis]|uniref:phosphoribosylformylglycinamidine cyclo-ligase n=1 Tax=Xenopus tropicalis TaxID=8364 RepID=A0A6I8QB19_XENTR|nr:hypothetical protein XENTR_v10004883 [Xenopus tropicalis]KAE8621566.1 hypothetical protein XENTR_v10004883 [Xenopus tropicalis]
MTDRVLVVGGGTRELVLAQKLSQSARVKQVLVAPGNTGAMGSEKITNSDVLISNPNILKQFCIDHNIRLVVVSQISLLAAGILDSLTAVGVRCFGPTAKAAQLEARRSFAKDFMDQHGIPMVQGKSFTNPHDACSFITYADFAALVVKPCSSASGRSLCIASDKDGACRAVQQLTHDTWTLGIPPETFLVEERLEGVEFSCLGFTDGSSLAPMPPVRLQNLKRDISQVSQATEMQENDPEPMASAPLLRKIQDTILQQISCALKKEGMSYAGVLGAKIMLTGQGPIVLGLKCTFQDFESQVLLPLLETDLYEVIQSAIDGHLHRRVPVWLQELCLVPAPRPTSGPLAGKEQDGQNDMSLEGLQSCVASASAQQNRGAVADFAGAARTRETHPKDRQKPDFTATAISEVHLDAEQSGEAAFRQDSIKCGYLPLNAAQHKDPMLVCTTNSTDAKIQIARTCSQHSKVAEGLVATCMNDMLAQGAKTLFFMPYMACGKLDADITQSIATGLVSACKSSGSTLFEREIAYLPNVYPEGSYTLSGCAVGIVEREHKLPQLERMKAGDWIVGLRAAGVHSDNTALIEKILRKCSIDYSSLLPVGKGEQTWGDMLLNPPLTYSNILLAFIQSGHIRAFAPITEGGLMGSLQRVLPQSLGVIVDALCWRLPAIFSWLYKEGALSEQEMVSSFNCGLGAVLIAQKGFAQQIVLQLQKQEEAWLIGALIQHRGEHSPVRVTHMLEALRVNSFPLLKSLTVQRASGNTRKVAVFISSPGTKLNLLIDGTRQPGSCARLSLAVCNKAAMGEVRRAAGAGIPTRVIDPTLCRCQSELESTICKVLEEFSIDLICLAGFGRNLSDHFLSNWKGKIMNLCPYLSTSLKMKEPLQEGLRVYGCTVCFTLAGTIPGPVILQETFMGEDNTDVSLSERMEEAKSRAVAKAVVLVASGIVQLAEDNTLRWMSRE